METKKVLVVEDEYTKKVDLLNALKKEKLTVVAITGENIVSQIEKALPTVVITDIDHNALPGEETAPLQKIRENPKLRGTSIFVYTTALTVSLEVQLRKLKIDSMFTKDENTDSIVKSVTKFFEPTKDDDTSLLDRARNYGQGLGLSQEEVNTILKMKKDALQAAQVTQPIEQASTPSVAEERNFESMFSEFSNKVHEQLGDQDVETFYNLGISYMDMELYQEAINEFKAALKGDQFKMESFSQIGVCLRKLNKHGAAIDNFKEAAKITKDPVELMGVKYEIGLTLTEAGKLKEAFNMLGTIYKQDKAYRDVAKRLVQIKKKLQG